jgi:hypothetical protein
MVGTSNKSVSEMAIDLRLQPIFTWMIQKTGTAYG